MTDTELLDALERRLRAKFDSWTDKPFRGLVAWWEDGPTLVIDAEAESRDGLVSPTPPTLREALAAALKEEEG